MTLTVAVIVLQIGGGWVPFHWDDRDRATRPCTRQDPCPVIETFTLETPARVRVVDCGTIGDRFEVFVDDMLLGRTSNPGPPTGINRLDDFDACWTDPHFSRGEFELPAGTIEIRVIGQSAGFPEQPAGIQALPPTVPALPPLGAFALAVLLLIGAGRALTTRRAEA